MNNVVERLKPRDEPLRPEHSARLLAAVISTRRPRIRHRRVYFMATVSLLIATATAVTVGPHLSTDNDRRNTRSVVTSECTPLVRVSGIIYEASTFTERLPATPVGRGDMSACDDNGRAAEGAYFPDAPEVVDVWSLDGLDRSQVVGVPQPDGFTVYIARSVEPSDRREILDVLEGAGEAG